ncbi:hypothetical protein GF359_00390 [candidate division WOR-3 bacterium]|uniref:Lipid A biosynthesis acyltransferase n=1 Tax=candidate division WOR-3 bacterium TaxID=2052148 RepID=A0A9D5K930_UNCW3|nr:hypothetical protein [candidate division WOR-3 bacterium]MBD3363651.1 hypothetical protein [candidate division WOR-3 bacterium]
MSAYANLIPYLSLLQRSLPEEALKPAAELTGKILASIQLKRRKAVEYNLVKLGIGDPQLSRSVIRHWSVCLADQIKSLWMNPGQLQSLVEDGWSKSLVKSKPVILVSAHLGNYELGGSYLASCGLGVHAVVEEIHGGHTRTLNRIRRRFGMGVVQYGDVSKMIKILKKGMILVLLSDRDIGESGLSVRFGRSKRRIPVGPAILAERTGAVIQPAYCIMKGRGYRLIVEEPIGPSAKPRRKERIENLTREINRRMVRTISKYPDQWFVFTNEWI